LSSGEEDTEMKSHALIFLFGGLLVFADGCRSVHDVQRMDAGKAQAEGSLVFVRPDRYTILGTKSMRDYIEIVYEEMKVDERGMAHVTVGVRNVGGRRWYDTKGPSVQIGAEIAFYRTKGVDSAPSYRSNRRSVVIQRGETAHLVFDCPVAGAAAYQIVFSDY